MVEKFLNKLKQLKGILKIYTSFYSLFNIIMSIVETERLLSLKEEMRRFLKGWMI
jgi:hypothetical protein